MDASDIPDGGHAVVASRREAYRVIGTARKLGLQIWMRRSRGGGYVLFRCARKDFLKLLLLAASDVMGSRPPMNRTLSLKRAAAGRKGGLARGKRKARSPEFYKQLSKIGHTARWKRG